ncbi:MAG: peptidase C39 family protein, partial [Hyphomicrobiales bacterium]|nr:peptidase C39 family protein [Hyphomicrobiales bacterium]
ADDPAAQAALWREIAPFPSDRRGGGAEAAGIALAAHRRGVATRLHVTRDRAIVGEAGAPSASSRAAALVAGDWRRQATDLAIPTTELPLMLEALERTLAGGGLAIVNFGARRGRWLLVHGCDGHDLAAIDPEARGDPATTVALASGLAPGPGFAVAREAALLERVRP